MRALLLAVCLAGAAAHAQPDPLSEIRYCGEPQRLSDGRIYRDSKVLLAFAKAHPCPETGRPTTSCRGVDRVWHIDHVIPLAVGGCDAVWNLQWLPTDLKSCAVSCKDRWERRVYAR
jgi:hypothetical protein